MNILELCLSPDLGGLELYAETASIELAKTEKVTVVYRDGGKLNERATEAKRSFLTLPKSFHHLPLQNAKALAQIVDQNNIDVIHVHWSKDLFLAVLGKLFSSQKPKVIYHRQMQIPSDKKSFYHSFIFKHIDKMLCITQNLVEEGKRHLPEHFSDKIELLYYGVKEPKELISKEKRSELRLSYGFNEKDYVIGLFGRIEEIKGQYLLVEAISKIQEENVKGLIVGRAMEESYLKDLKSSAEEKCGSKIAFQDFVNNPQELMQCCDLVLLATKNETFGLVLAEAMFCNVPIIGSNQGGVPEIVGNDESRGLMFKTRDALDLQKKLEFAYSNQETMKEKAGKALEFARKEFDFEKHFEELKNKIKK